MTPADPSEAFYRGRRNRRTDALRSMVRETRLSVDSFMYPMFVTHGEGVRQPIEPMPGRANQGLLV